MSDSCPLGCRSCGALCLCACHKAIGSGHSKTLDLKSVKFYDDVFDDVFDDVAAGRKIFFDDLKFLRLDNDGMKRMLKFIFSQGYKLSEGVLTSD